MAQNCFRGRRWFILFGVLLCFTGAAMGQFPETSYDIYGIEVRTGRIFQVSRLAGAGEFNPSWSQDSRYIVHDVTFAPPTEQCLGVTDVKTGETTLLTGGAGGNNGAWSPNGQWIAFDRCPGFAHGCADASIYIVPAGGGTPRLVVSDAVSPRWSPNSMRIIFQRPSNGSIMVIDITGANEKLVIGPGPGEWWMNSPSWAPNGQWIVFEWYGYILKLPVDQFGQRQGDFQVVANDYNYNYSPAWSNNSKAVVFGRNSAIWQTPASAEQYVQMTVPGEWGDYDAAYSNDGQYIAFAGYSPRSLAKQAVLPQIEVPAAIALEQNYPNPFNPSTTIRYGVPTTSYVTLAVFNTLGQQVALLVEGEQEAGYHEVRFDASNLSSGVYFYKLQAGTFVQTRKLMLLR